MAGIKGQSGRISEDMQAWCGAVVREIALPKMRRCLQKETPHSASFRWCVEQLAKMGNVYAPTQHEHSGTVQVTELTEAAEAFTSRTNRLVARLGTAAMPEGPE